MQDFRKNTSISRASVPMSQTGFEGFSIKALAEHTGIKAPTILYHFKNKSEIFREIILIVTLICNLKAFGGGTASVAKQTLEHPCAHILGLLTSESRPDLRLYRLGQQLEQVITVMDLKNKNIIEQGSYVALLSYGVAVLGDKYPDAVEQLLRIMALTPPDKAGTEIAKWMQLFIPQFRLVLKPELLEIAMQLSASNILDSRMTELRDGEYREVPIKVILPSNGYIDPQLWTLLVAKGRIPLGDAHDVFSHLASFLDPNLRRELQRNAKLSFLIASLHRDRGREFGTNDPLFREINEIGTQLRNLTAHTYENLSYISESAPGPRLVLQGNGGYNFLDELVWGFGRRRVHSRPSLKFDDALDSLLKREHSFNKSSLSRVDAFELSHPQVAVPFHRAKQKMSLHSDVILSSLIERVRTHLHEAMDQYRNANEDMIYTEGIIRHLAMTFQKDSELQQMFNYENRMELLGSGNNYFEAYLEWFQNEAGLQSEFAEVNRRFESVP